MKTLTLLTVLLYCCPIYRDISTVELRAVLSTVPVQYQYTSTVKIKPENMTTKKTKPKQSIYEVDEKEFRKRIVAYVKDLKQRIDKQDISISDLEASMLNLEGLDSRVFDLENQPE
jgi:hypothetical protein